MKNLIYLAVMLFAAFTVSSCKEDEPELSQSKQGDAKKIASSDLPEAEYTICFYGSAGGNLDGPIVEELMRNASSVESTNGKVRVVGIYKPAKYVNQSLGKEGGARYFEIRRNGGITSEKVSSDGRYVKDAVDQEQAGLYGVNALIKDFVGERYADANFRMSDPSSMAEALKYLTQKAPAKKYVLMCVNHGAGWNFAQDKPLTTRGMISDDNTLDPGISLDQLRAGVKQSGVKFDVLFCDLCLMATLENLYGYSDTFPICIASAEETDGGNFGYLAQRLAAIGGGATHEQLFSACSEWTTTTDVNAGYRRWETMGDLKTGSAEFMDLGCYDLTKIGNITAPLQKISSWFNRAMSDKDLRYVVEKSAITTLYTVTPSGEDNDMLVRQDAVSCLELPYGRSMTVDSLADKVLNGYDAQMYRTLTNSDNSSISLYYKFQKQMNCGYPMAYFVWNTARIARQYNMTREAGELQSLLDSYEAALKSMCRIKCSFEDFRGSTYDGVDYPAMDPYLWTSPTVIIASLDGKGFDNDAVLGYSPWAARYGLTLSNALTTYTSTMFDQTTGWSKFLQQLDYNPNVVTNVFRQIPVYSSK